MSFPPGESTTLSGRSLAVSGWGVFVLVANSQPTA
jgi:hypothetical protein